MTGYSKLAQRALRHFLTEPEGKAESSRQLLIAATQLYASQTSVEEAKRLIALETGADLREEAA